MKGKEMSIAVLQDDAPHDTPTPNAPTPTSIPLHNATLNRLLPPSSASALGTESRQLYTSERTAVTVEMSRSGTSVLISETGRNGAAIPRRIIHAQQFPYFADMRLSNGDWITVEVRRTAADGLPEDFDDEPPMISEAPISEAPRASEASASEALCDALPETLSQPVGVGTEFKPLRTRCNLLQFSPD